MRRLSVMVISVGILLLMALPAFASGTPFSISGTVIDVHGDRVKGANVSLLVMERFSDTQQIVNSTLTNDTGYYGFAGTSPDKATITVRVSYNDGNKTYQIPASYTRWYPVGWNPEDDHIVVNSSETQFQDYPPATEGYVTGTFYTNDTPFGEKTSGDIYLVSVDGKNQYHESVNASNGSYFTFHVPAGSYEIHATSDVKDLRYTSGTQNITVLPSWTLDYVNSTNGISKDGVPTTIVNGVPFTIIYLEPGSRQLIMPSPTIAANMSSMINSPALPEIPAKTVVEVTAGGAAVASCAYLLFKFFGIGAVTRAGGRLYKNKNRNDLYKFIADNPGVTLHDIAHTLDMNLGTIRYHLFILSLNHRIVSSRFDEKFVRYFTNSGSFSKDEQLAISLVRREGIRKVISLLLNEPGLTNAEISNKLGIRVSATSRYIKELTDKGLVAKMPQENGTLLYSINGGQKEHIACILERVNNG